MASLNAFNLVPLLKVFKFFFSIFIPEIERVICTFSKSLRGVKIDRFFAL